MCVCVCVKEREREIFVKTRQIGHEWNSHRKPTFGKSESEIGILKPPLRLETISSVEAKLETHARGRLAKYYNSCAIDHLGKRDKKNSSGRRRLH